MEQDIRASVVEDHLGEDPCDFFDDGAIRIRVTDFDGREHVLPAVDGWRVMEVIRDWGLPIEAECGGSCACGTCHVYVGEAWMGKLPPATDEEMDQLDLIYGVQENSRLACQILTAADLDGLEIRLAPRSETD